MIISLFNKLKRKKELKNKIAIFQFGEKYNTQLNEYIQLFSTDFNIDWYFYEADGTFDKEEEIKDLKQYYDLILEVL